MKRYLRNEDAIFAMSDVRGKYVTVAKVPFSFYYSVQNSNHGPRVKVTMNPEKLRANRMSSMKLCDDWSIDQNPDDARISSKDAKLLKEFFRKYLVLFLIVWCDLINEPDLRDYLEGRISLEEFITDTDFYDNYSSELDTIHSVEDLEDFCRTNNIVNFYGN